MCKEKQEGWKALESDAFLLGVSMKELGFANAFDMASWAGLESSNKPDGLADTSPLELAAIVFDGVFVLPEEGGETIIAGGDRLVSDCWTTAAAGTPDTGVNAVVAEVPTVATGKLLPIGVSAFPWETAACKACSGSTGIPTPKRFSLKKLPPRL